MRGTGSDDDAGLLRIDFGAPEENLEQVDWQEWFETFDANGLAFLHEDASDSRFNKLISRDSD